MQTYKYNRSKKRPKIKTKGAAFAGQVSVILFVLRATEYIEWSWWWIWAPTLLMWLCTFPVAYYKLRKYRIKQETIHKAALAYYDQMKPKY
jgi:hypothetical protein